jgi:phosphoglycerate dehydrogenase-like enzyme
LSNAAVVFQSEYLGELQPYDFEEEALIKYGATLRVGRPGSSEELAADAAGAGVLWVEWGPPVTSEVLQALPQCELVVRWGVGYDQIDVEAATSLGIAVANCPSYCTSTVAEHAIALLLAVTRRVAQRDRTIRAGQFDGSGWGCETIGGRTLGVVGTGRIGRRVAGLGQAFGCRVLGHDVDPTIAPAGVEMVGLRDLLEQSDFVSLHVPLSASSHHLMDTQRLAWMKPGAVLVNTSRGPVVDEAALASALESGALSGAGLDVFEVEPLPVASPLLNLGTVVMTPHEASSSPASLTNLRAEMCSTTASWLATGWADAVVNPAVRDRRRWRGSR